jgi:hypothetical protein
MTTLVIAPSGLLNGMFSLDAALWTVGLGRGRSSGQPA